MKSVEKPYTVNVLNKRIVVFPYVFPPKTDTVLLIKSVKVKRGEAVLEPFAGTGLVSVFLAKNASKVISTDINPYAVRNIDKNIELHGLGKKMKAVRANIFPRKAHVFDLIVANPPYTDSKANGMAEKAFWDKGHRTLRLFFRRAKKHLTPKGRIYCSWPNFADFGFFEKLVRAEGYSLCQVGRVSKKWKEYRVYEIKPI
jgi:methylase of polypeptide subunit release factors